MAQESGAAVNVTRPFTQGEVLPEIGQAPEFYKTAFSLGSKEISSVIEGTNGYYVLESKQRIEPRVPPFDAVRSNLEKSMKESKATKWRSKRAKALLDQLKKEKDINKLAQQNNLKLEETGRFPRNAAQLPKVGELSEFKSGRDTLSAREAVSG